MKPPSVETLLKQARAGVDKLKREQDERRHAHTLSYVDVASFMEKLITAEAHVEEARAVAQLLILACAAADTKRRTCENP